MSATFKSIKFLLMWFVISTVLVISYAYETYDETDQLAEETEEDKGHEETTNKSIVNYSLEEAIVAKDEKSAKDVSAEDDPNDPLQNILPKITFNCKGKPEGYYADNGFCQVFHYCKTNGFRFTFMCPPESYYNDKLMACEFNSSVSLCKNRDKYKNNDKINDKNHKVLNTSKEALIKPSAGERVEVYKAISLPSTQNYTDINESDPTTTAIPVTVIADPYLTKWRATYGLRNRSDEKVTENVQNIEQNPQNNTNVNKQKSNETEVLLANKPFGRRSRTKIYTDRSYTRNKPIDDKKNEINSTANSTNNSMTHPSIPSNAWPIINSVKNHFIVNSSLVSRHRTRTRTTTTAPPSLVSPTSRSSTTVSPFDYFIPLNIFDSDKNFDPNTDLFSLTSHRRQENSSQKGPVLTQNYYNSISHSPSNQSVEREPQIEDNTDNERNQVRTNSEHNPGYPQFQPRQVAGQEFSDYRAPVWDNFFGRQPNDMNRVRTASVNDIKASESRKLSSFASQRRIPSMNELIEKLKQIEANHDLDTDSDESEEVETSIEPNEMTDEFDESVETDNEDNTNKEMLTVPVLVPTGMSRNDLKRRLSATLLKPTVLPLSESGQRMPAYVLHFQNTKRSHKTRSKRQAYNWNNPYLRNNPFLSNSYYLPMTSMSSQVYSGFDSFGNALPLQAYNGRNHISIGEKPGLRMNPLAQQHMPYYVPHKQPFLPVPNNFYSSPNFHNDIYDLSEFSDFNTNTLHKRPNHMMSDDLIPYRAVSLRRPSFKRPPRRQKIPGTKNGSNETKNDSTNTTPRPSNTIPVSPRPYSHPLRQRYYTMNSNPFTDFADENHSNDVKLFDDSEDQFQTTDFDTQSIYPKRYPTEFKPSSFTPIPSPKGRNFANGLNGRSSRINSLSQPPLNGYVPEDFPPLPRFGDSDYRLPFIDNTDPLLTSSGFRPNYFENYNKDYADRKHDNNNGLRFDNSSRYSTPYSPEVGFNIKTDNTKPNETERNPNHNYDIVDKELQTAQTGDSLSNLGLNFNSRLYWDNIVGQYNKPNHTIDKSIYNSNQNKSDEKEPKEPMYISYGTRLSGTIHQSSLNPTISVKSSVRSVSSLQPESSNQIIISKKSGTSMDSSMDSSERVNDKTLKRIDELYNQRASDRLMLFNYYSHLNSQKYKPSTTTTPRPSENRYPSTSHWSIRGWTGQYYPHSTGKTTSTTVAPITTTNNDFEFIDLIESEAMNSETTTESSQLATTGVPEPPYQKVFNSHMGATLQSNSKSKSYSYSQKTRSDISNYLNSLTTSTQKSI